MAASWKFEWHELYVTCRQKHQKGAFLQIIYQKGVLLQLFLEGVYFFIAKRPPPRRLHCARDTWHREVAPLTQAPLVVPRGQALLVAPLLQALRLAQGSQAPAPPLNIFFSHPSVSSHTPPPQNFIFFILFIKNLNFVSSFLLVLFVIFLYSHTPTPKFQ